MKRRLTKRRKEMFLNALRETGVVRRAVAAASPGARDAHQTFYEARDRDPVFRAQWDEALNSAIGDAEKALYDMGVTGVVEREQFDANGNVRNRVVRRDVRALQLYLAARVPEYRRQAVVEASVDAKVRAKLAPDLTGLSDEDLAELERLLAKGSRG